MLLIPTLIGAALVGSGLWLKAQNTEQARTELQKLKLIAENPNLGPKSDGDIEGALLPAALAIGIVSAILIARG